MFSREMEPIDVFVGGQDIRERDYGILAMMQKDCRHLCSGLKDSALPPQWHRLKVWLRSEP